MFTVQKFSVLTLGFAIGMSLGSIPLQLGERQMTIYYVSSEIGSNNNAGTSQNAPLASLQAAANLVKPGDTVQVMNGTYTAPTYADAVDITTSGTANAPITFEAAPGRRLSLTVREVGTPLISRRHTSSLRALRSLAMQPTTPCSRH